MKRVVIVILNWNGIDDTLDCLKSLGKQSYNNHDILVVDNGSNDDSKPKLKEYQSKNKNINLIFEPNNLGFTGGVNRGIQWAIDNKYKYVALFNNDATADKKWLGSLVEQLDDNKKIGIATGLLLLADGKKIDSTGEQYSKWGLPFPRNRGHLASKKPTSEFTFGATGGASLYRVKMLKEIGLFDNDFFAYYEDTDVSFRAQLAGWKVKYTEKAIAYHKQGETSKKIPGFTVYQTFKNLPLLFIKNVPRELIFAIGIRFYFAYIMMYLNTIKNGTWKHSSKGILESIILTPKKISERLVIQRNKKVDTDYIKNILWPDLPPDQTGLRKLRNFFIKK